MVWRLLNMVPNISLRKKYLVSGVIKEYTDLPIYAANSESQLFVEEIKGLVKKVKHRHCSFHTWIPKWSDASCNSSSKKNFTEFAENKRLVKISLTDHRGYPQPKFKGNTYHKSPIKNSCYQNQRNYGNKKGNNWRANRWTSLKSQRTSTQKVWWAINNWWQVLRQKYHFFKARNICNRLQKCENFTSGKFILNIIKKRISM